MNDAPAEALIRRNAPNPLIDPVTLEVLRNALESIADEMGAVLKRTSFSPNIKERMDASCAVFDAKAQLVAQAEHVPVHLGSMLRSVEATIAAVGAVVVTGGGRSILVDQQAQRLAREAMFLLVFGQTATIRDVQMAPLELA